MYSEQQARDLQARPAQQPRESLPSGAGATASALRSLTVMFGGPVLITTASIAMVGIGLLARPRSARSTRIVRSLAAAGAAFPWIYEFAISPWQLNWGLSENEAHRMWPGDHIVPNPAYESTHAVTIYAPPEKVWPWIMQLGFERGGFYSYDWLENLAGVEIHTINQITPELQKLELGDAVLIGPDVGFVVDELEPNRSLVLRARDPQTGHAVQIDPQQRSYFDGSWAFILEDLGEGATRLIVRTRFDGKPRAVLQKAIHALLESPHFIMERKMLLGIKRRAERG